MKRTEKEILFELAVRVSGDILDKLEISRKTQLLYQLSEYVRNEEEPTLKGVFNIAALYVSTKT